MEGEYGSVTKLNSLNDWRRTFKQFGFNKMIIQPVIQEENLRFCLRKYNRTNIVKIAGDMTGLTALILSGNREMTKQEVKMASLTRSPSALMTSIHSKRSETKYNGREIGNIRKPGPDNSVVDVVKSCANARM
ncbi:hypothetical protein ABEB36_002742 [Hypothenemus hampei]|uniref:Uncharacterized protein n=1 Tax=Hypothenemus hampei TaxID=57062 RepID=A0ABD1F9H1_HYPHA